MPVPQTICQKGIDVKGFMRHICRDKFRMIGKVMGNEQESAAKRPGRPPLPVGEGKRHALGIRTTAALKAQIEAAAQLSGRSLAQEIEYRLERSFADDLQDSLLGRQAAAFLRLIDRSLRHAPGACGLSATDDWLNNPDAYDIAVRELGHVAEPLRPPGQPRSETARYAETQAQRTLLALGDESPNEPWSRWAAAMRSDLGPAMAARAIAWRARFVSSREGEGEE
jgi:hypothetical protein